MLYFVNIKNHWESTSLKTLGEGRKVRRSTKSRNHLCPNILKPSEAQSESVENRILLILATSRRLRTIIVSQKAPHTYISLTLWFRDRPYCFRNINYRRNVEDSCFQSWLEINFIEVVGGNVDECIQCTQEKHCANPKVESSHTEV